MRWLKKIFPLIISFIWINSTKIIFIKYFKTNYTCLKWTWFIINLLLYQLNITWYFITVKLILLQLQLSSPLLFKMYKKIFNHTFNYYNNTCIYIISYFNETIGKYIFLLKFILQQCIIISSLNCSLSIYLVSKFSG